MMMTALHKNILEEFFENLKIIRNHKYVRGGDSTVLQSIE